VVAVSQAVAAGPTRRSRRPDKGFSSSISNSPDLVRDLSKETCALVVVSNREMEDRRRQILAQILTAEARERSTYESGLLRHSPG
jgi:hypothetical protein